MDLNSLKLFYEACKVKSFTKASQNLYISQSAVSIQIKKLEQNLDVQLIERNSKSFKLTREGQSLFKMAKDLFEKVDRMEIAMKRLIDKQNKKIAIGATHNVGEPILPNIVREYLKERPDIELDIFVKNSATLYKYLKEGTLDVILTEDFFIKDDELKIINTEDYPFVVIAPNNIEDYMELKNIFYLKRNNEQNVLYMNKFEEKVGFTIDKQMNVNGSIETTKHLVKMGVGYAVLPYYCVYENLKNKEFKVIYRFIKTYNKFQIMCMKENMTNKIITDFVSFVRNIDIKEALKDIKKV